MKNVVSAEFLLIARPNLLWQVGEHFVRGHNGTIVLWCHLQFIQLQMTENPVLLKGRGGTLLARIPG